MEHMLMLPSLSDTRSMMIEAKMKKNQNILEPLLSYHENGTSERTHQQKILAARNCYITATKRRREQQRLGASK
jgi:hypothetical protein